MAINQISFPNYTINSQADFTPLVRLGEQYRTQAAEAAKSNTLASLGDDPATNARIMIGSGIPDLATMGLAIQRQLRDQAREDARYAVTDARAQAQLGIQQAAAARAAGEYAQAEKDRLAAPGLIDAFYARAGAGRATPAFPAPLPDGQGAPSFPAPLPAAPEPQTAQQPPPVQPSAFEATPRLPPTLQPRAEGGAPPVMAQGDEPSALPGWVQAAQAAPPSLVDRITTNLVSDQPAQAAGIDRAQLAALYANPNTKPLAVAFLQKQFSPDEWAYHIDNESGRVIATNKFDPGKTKDVTPGGATPISKQEREVQNYYQAGLAQGLQPEQARTFALNKGKLPSENLSVHDRKAIDDNDNVFISANTARDNIQRLKELSPKAFQGVGASALGAVTSQFGEGAGSATTEYNNIALRNVIAMVKSAFPRPTEYETKLMQRIETGADMPRKVRDDLLVDLDKQLKIRADEAQFKSEAIRDQTYYKRGGGAGAPTFTPPPPPPAAAAQAAPSAAKPTLGEFMTKARAANPGYTDSEIAREWKSRYGG